jgi:hypothetical protein
VTNLTGVCGIDFVPAAPAVSLLALGETQSVRKIHELHRAAYIPATDVLPYLPEDELVLQ